MKKDGDRRTRSNYEKKASATGIILTLAIHLVAITAISFTGLKYIYPPPEEKQLLIDFSEEDATPVQELQGREPQAENVNLDKPVELVQKSASPYASKSENLTPKPRLQRQKKSRSLIPAHRFPGWQKRIQL
jgi:hypothetical protein